MQALMQALPFFSNLLFQRDDKKSKGLRKLAEIRLNHFTFHKTESIALSNGRVRESLLVCDMCEGITLMFPKAALQLTISGFLSVQHRAESAVLLCLH